MPFSQFRRSGQERLLYIEHPANWTGLMTSPNPYTSPDEAGFPSGRARNRKSVGFSIVRGAAIYVPSCLFLGSIVAPLIAPTDSPPDGAPAVPAYLVAVQVLVCYGVPCLLVYLDHRRAAT